MRKFECHFALPLLLAKWSNRAIERTERNGLEAHLVGSAVHLIAYLFAFQLLLLRLPVWEQLLLALPLAVLVWIFWLVFLYLDSLLIRSLRAGGVITKMSDGRAQSVNALGLTSVFALGLVATGAWPRVVGYLWLAAIALNLLAAFVLILRGTDR